MGRVKTTLCLLLFTSFKTLVAPSGMMYKSINPIWDFSPTYYSKIGILTTPLGLAVHPRTTNILHLAIKTKIYDIDDFPKTNCSSVISNINEIKSHLYSRLVDLDRLIKSYQGDQELIKGLCKGYDTILCQSFEREEGEIGKMRQKRFLPLLAAGMGLTGLGLSIYNTINEHDVHSAINNIEEHLEEIDKVTNTIQLDFKNLVHVSQAMAVKIQSMEKQLYLTMENLKCEIETREKYLYYIQLVDEAYSKMSEMLQTLMSGKISSIVLNPDEVRDILSNNDLWINSLYKSDVNVFYLLSRVTPILFDVKSHTLHLIIHFPDLKMNDIAPLVRVESIGWGIGRNFKSKLITSDTVALFKKEESFLALDVDMNTCTKINWVYNCPSMSVSETPGSRCVNDILHRSITNQSTVCHQKVKTSNEQIIKQVPSGILVTGYSCYYKISDTIRGIKHREEKGLNKNEWSLIDLRSVGTVQVGELYFALAHNQYYLKVDKDISLTDFKWDFEEIALPEWTDFDKINTTLKELSNRPIRQLDFHPYTLGTKVGGTVIVILLICGIVLMIVLWKRNRKICSDHSTVILSKIDPNSSDLQPLT